MPVDKLGRDSSHVYRRTESGVSVRYVNNNFLRSVGTSTVTGPLKMGNNRISNVVDPIDIQDVATKQYVDIQSDTKLARNGDILQGDFDVNFKRLKNLPYPSLSDDGANKIYVDQLTNDSLRKTGDTMGGELNTGGKRITNLPISQPINKTDVARQEDFDFVRDVYLNSSKINVCCLTGRQNQPKVLVGIIKNISLANPANQDAATKFYVDAKCEELLRMVVDITTANGP